MRRLWSSFLVVVLTACDGPAPSVGDVDHLSIRFLAGESPSGFARVTMPRDFAFPQDHGSHPEYRSEWWYFTGNLFDEAQRHFGFELTFFRIALSPEAPYRQSAWGTNQVWMAHFAVTDSARGRFFADERFARGALGLAGATAEPLRVWLESWSVGGAANGSDARLELSARQDEIELDLSLVASKPPVAHGNRGVDAKGPEPGNASYYYSLPRLDASGTIAIDGETTEVHGLAWMDREWGTSALSANLAGWDWFAMHLSDGRDLMFYRLRGSDGSASPFSGGSLIDTGGERIALGESDVELQARRLWHSARSGARYPVAWRLRVPRHGIDLEIEPRLDDQELDLSVRYWEGAIRVAGTAGDKPLTGDGYLELTGY